MRRLLSLVAIFILLTTMLAFTTTAYASYVVYSHCGNGRSLNVREGPGKDYWIMNRIPYGEAILVDGEAEPGWLHVSDGGYVQAALTCSYYPGPYVPSPTPTSSPKKKAATNVDDIYDTARLVAPYMITLKATARSSGVANVRWAPVKTARLQKTYSAGSEMKVIAELKNWYQVQDPISGAVGFVNTAYVAK